MIPTGVLGLEVRVRAWVPIDDGHTFGLGMHKVAGVDTPGGTRPFRDPTTLLPNTTDWLGRFRTEANAHNDFQIDRDKQRRLESYTGLPSVTLEDQAVTESMGDIYDRTQEHLGTSDTMIIRTRRRMLDAAKALRDTAMLPPAWDDPKAYAVRTGGIMLPNGVDWLEGSAELRRGFVEHPELSRQVLGGIPAV